MAIAELTLSKVAGYACLVYKVITHKLRPRVKQQISINRRRQSRRARACHGYIRILSVQPVQSVQTCGLDFAPEGVEL